MSVLSVDAVRDLLDSGKTDSEIGAALGVSKDSVRRFRLKYGLQSTVDNRGRMKATSYPIRDNSPICDSGPINLSPLAFAVPIASPPKPKVNRGKRAIIIPDVHVPFHDEGAVAIAESLVRSFVPDYLICIGDLLDAGRLSLKFPTDPKRIDTLQGDIDTARVMLHRWAQLAPHARRVLLEGNHEQRLTRLIWGLDGASRELAKLTAFQHAMTWPHLLGLDQIGWEWVPYEDQPRADILPHLLVKHGNFVSSEAGMTAKREWSKYGKSGVSGHTHRAAVWRHKDYNGQATWIEAGTLSRLDVPGASSPNWQQAVTLIEWSEDEELMHVEQVIIRDGRALWRGEEVAA